MPEQVNASFEYPFYAKVTELNRDRVKFRSLDGDEGVVDRDVAERHTIPASQVNKAGRVSILRRPVAVKIDERVHYGQVVAVDSDHATVQTEGSQVRATMDAISVVAPVVALLLNHVEFNCVEWSVGEIETVEASILNRILGRNGVSSTNDITDIFDGLMDEENYPASTKVCRWIDPLSGDPTSFQLQHAVDYAYYADGGAGNVPSTVGTSFCRPPSAHVQIGSNSREMDAFFDPFADDDEAAQDPAVPDNGGTVVALSPVPSGKRRREVPVFLEEEVVPVAKSKQRRTALDQDAMIVDKLRDDPDLLERFLSVRHDRNNSSGDSQCIMDAKTIPRSPVKPSLSQRKTSKYDFVPREEQQRVHERVTSVKHKGKTASIYVKSVVRSEHAKFKALPGVCTRVYDIRFGSSGLSIRHFARISQTERMAWLESGGSNFDNLSATAEFSAATPATCVEEVVDATRVFLTYAREFCCAELIALVEGIVEFIEETLMRVSWSSNDLPSLVYWVNDLLEDFRTAAENDENLSRVRSRCSTDDRLLKDLMFVKVHRQADDMRQAKPSVVAASGDRQNTQAARKYPTHGDSKKRLGRISRDVLRQLPVKRDPASGKSQNLCMRFLSKAGCSSDSDGVCPSDHAHFVPKKLPEIVKTEIGKRFGGLKDEYKQL